MRLGVADLHHLPFAAHAPDDATDCVLGRVEELGEFCDREGTDRQRNRDALREAGAGEEIRGIVEGRQRGPNGVGREDEATAERLLLWV